MAPGRLMLVALAALCAVGPAAAHAAALSPAQARRIDAVVQAAMTQQHLVGVEIGIGRRGSPLFARGYGLRNREQHLPVTSDTIFPIGSVTKQFTAAAVMQLVQSGKVYLDAKVSRYLPRAPHGSQVTVRELLDQTSGLPDYLEDKPLLTSIENGTVKPRSVPAYVALVADKPLAFPPGTKWAYSNTNYALLGMLIGAVSGSSYDQYLRTHILDPLALDHTQILTYSVPQGTNVTRGYTYAKGVNALVPDYSMAWGNAAGFLASTVDDLIAWDGGFFGGNVISPTSVQIATTPPAGIAMVPGPHAGEGLTGGYAFGWVRGHDEGRSLIWHNGGLIGARSMNLVFPGDGLEIAVLTNATTADPEGIALRISRVIYDARSASKQPVTPGSP